LSVTRAILCAKFELCKFMSSNATHWGWAICWPRDLWPFDL